MALSVEREVAGDVGGRPINVISTGAALGAEIRGIDLRNLDPMQFAALKRAWHDQRRPGGHNYHCRLHGPICDADADSNDGSGADGHPGRARRQ